MNLDSFRLISIQWNNDSIYQLKICSTVFTPFFELIVSLRNWIHFIKHNLGHVNWKQKNNSIDPVKWN